MKPQIEVAAVKHGDEIIIQVDVPSINTHFSVDLNHILRTKLYRSGYPQDEEHRIKGAPRISI